MGFHISLVTSTITELRKGEDQEHPSLEERITLPSRSSYHQTKRRGKRFWTCNRKDILPSRKKNDGTEQEIGSRLMSDDTLFPLKIRSQNEGLASNGRIVAIVQRKGMDRTGDVKTIPCQWITKGGIVTFFLFLPYFLSSVQWKKKHEQLPISQENNNVSRTSLRESV